MDANQKEAPKCLEWNDGWGCGCMDVDSNNRNNSYMVTICSTSHIVLQLSLFYV